MSFMTVDRCDGEFVQMESSVSERVGSVKTHMCIYPGPPYLFCPPHCTRFCRGYCPTFSNWISSVGTWLGD